MKLMSSRLEQRRLEAAMKASMGDGEKDKGSKDKKARAADTSSSQASKKPKVERSRAFGLGWLMGAFPVCGVWRNQPELED